MSRPEVTPPPGAVERGMNRKRYPTVRVGEYVDSGAACVSTVRAAVRVCGVSQYLRFRSGPVPVPAVCGDRDEMVRAAWPCGHGSAVLGAACASSEVVRRDR